MLQTRAAHLEDISEISSVLAASWKTAYRGIVHDEYLDLLKNSHWIDFLTSGLNDGNIFAMVLEDSQGIIGAAILGETEIKHESCLISFYLLPDKIGQGFGHDFYDGIEAELKSRGFSNCILDVLDNNKRAIRFYKAHGFTDTDRKIKVELGDRNYICKVLEKALC